MPDLATRVYKYLYTTIRFEVLSSQNHCICPLTQCVSTVPIEMSVYCTNGVLEFLISWYHRK